MERQIGDGWVAYPYKDKDKALGDRQTGAFALRLVGADRKTDRNCGWGGGSNETCTLCEHCCCCVQGG